MAPEAPLSVMAEYTKLLKSYDIRRVARHITDIGPFGGIHWHRSAANSLGIT
jgi:hypothetical protein